MLGGTAGNDIIIAGDRMTTRSTATPATTGSKAALATTTCSAATATTSSPTWAATDIIQGGAGNDVIRPAMSTLALGNLILGGDGRISSSPAKTSRPPSAATATTSSFGARPTLPDVGNEGDDWIEMGTQDGAPGDNFDPFLADDVIGNDIFVGGGGFDEMIGEGGDDIFVGSDAQDKMDGMSGFDWVTYKKIASASPSTWNSPLSTSRRSRPHQRRSWTASPRSKASRVRVHRLSARHEADPTSSRPPTRKPARSTAEGITRIDGLQAVLRSAFGLQPSDGTSRCSVPAISSWAAMAATSFGRGGDDVIDGDAWLNVRVSVRANLTAPAPRSPALTACAADPA